MGKITEQQWNELYEKAHNKFLEYRRKSQMPNSEFDKFVQLRLSINFFNSGKRTRRLFDEMTRAAE